MKEMQRTCKRDSTHVWYVSLDDAKKKAPSKLEHGLARFRASGDRMSFSHKHNSGELQLANVEARAERVHSISRCPVCGSQAFTEKKVKV
jgi:hypothetical protein